MAKAVKFFAFGCPHAPLQDNEHIEWLRTQIRVHKPDYIFCLGDLHEADSASKWPSEYDWELTDEYREANSVLKAVRTAAPKHVKCVLLPGNHDDNLISINRLPSKVRGTCDWRRKQFDDSGNWLNEELLTHWHCSTPYTYSPKGLFQLGQITFCHGYECGQNADECHSILLAKPYGLYVGTHTHRPLPVTQARRSTSIPLPYWFCNTGCSRDMDCEYMRRKRQHQWGQGCVIGSCDPSVKISDKCHWDAAMLLRRMHGE